ncbi:3D domain-containing protein [Chungangia koreensis]|uniref:3D domain-containing protein n=1 Tax=Chungangia koreensis TaxID=752657 RepID=A0ABV8X4P4_9LACT
MKKKIIVLTALLILGVLSTPVSAETNISNIETGVLAETFEVGNYIAAFGESESQRAFLNFPNFELFLASAQFGEEEEQKTYTVQEGDTLYRIALDNNISLDALLSWNDLSTDLIHPGDVLAITGDDAEVKEVNYEPVTIASVSESAPPAVMGTMEMTVTATAYTAYCPGCSGTTAIGIDLRTNPDQKVIAVDPNVIPLGSRVWVEGYGEAIAGDTGGAIKGNKIDVFIPSYDDAIQWGVKKVKIKVLN